MDQPAGSPSDATSKFHWFPEFLQLRQPRIHAQVRLLGLAMLVGVVAGLGAIVFYVATRAAEHYCLGVVVGYDRQAAPGGRSQLSRGFPPITPPALSLAAADRADGGRAPERAAGL